MDSNIVFAIIPLVGLVIAVLSAAGIWYWWVTGKEEKGEAVEPPPDDEPEPLVKLPKLDLLRRAAALASPATTSSENTIEVMRVYRDLADGSLIVDIAGRRYRHVSEIDDPETARRLVGNVHALAAIAGISGGVGAPPIAASAPRTEPPPQAATPPPDPFLAERLQKPPDEPEKPVRRGLFGQRKDKLPPMPEPKSFVEQIEELLQFRLATTPELAHRAIHISPGLGDGVVVEVDGAFYDGVGEIPDEQVRTFVQATIREWERHQ